MILNIQPIDILYMHIPEELLECWLEWIHSRKTCHSLCLWLPCHSNVHALDRQPVLSLVCKTSIKKLDKNI